MSRPVLMRAIAGCLALALISISAQRISQLRRMAPAPLEPKIVFVHHQLNSLGEHVYMMNLDGSERRALAVDASNSRTTHWSQPVLSPTGGLSLLCRDAIRTPTFTGECRWISAHKHNEHGSADRIVSDLGCRQSENYLSQQAVRRLPRTRALDGCGLVRIAGNGDQRVGSRSFDTWNRHGGEDSSKKRPATFSSRRYIHPECRWHGPKASDQ